MVDRKIGGSYNVGQVRMNWLDFSNMYFAQGNFIECKRAIDNFLDTVKDDGVSGKDIKKEFDVVFAHKKKVEDEVEEKRHEMGFLEEKNFVDTMRSNLEIDTIHELKSICWRICLRDGLFNE